MQKVYENNSEPMQPQIIQNDDVVVKIYDQSITSPFYQFKKQSYREVMEQSEKRRAKNLMSVAIHQSTSGDKED